MLGYLASAYLAITSQRERRNTRQNRTSSWLKRATRSKLYVLANKACLALGKALKRRLKRHAKNLLKRVTRKT